MSSDQFHPWISSYPTPAIAAPPQSEAVSYPVYGSLRTTAARPKPPFRKNRCVAKICSVARFAVCDVAAPFRFTSVPSTSQSSSRPGRRPNPNRNVYPIPLVVVVVPYRSFELRPPKPMPPPMVKGRSVTSLGGGGG